MGARNRVQSYSVGRLGRNVSFENTCSFLPWHRGCGSQRINICGTNKNASRDQGVGGRTVGVLRDVKLPQDHNCVFSKVPTSGFV